MSIIKQITRSKKSTYKPQFIDKPVIERLLVNANYAHSRKLIKPWNFKIYTSHAKSDLGNFLSKKYRENEVNSLGDEHKNIKKCKLTKAAITLDQDLLGSIPEWKETVEIYIPLENLWIGLAPYGLDRQWISPPVSYHLGAHAKLNKNELHYFFYLGNYESMTNRWGKDVAGKVE